MYLLYSVLSVVALLLASPFLVFQAVRHRKYVRSLRQRLGSIRRSSKRRAVASSAGRQAARSAV